MARPVRAGAAWGRHVAAAVRLAVAVVVVVSCWQYVAGATDQTLQLQSQLPAISLISNIAGYGWQPGFPCNSIAPGAIECAANDGFVTALNLPRTFGGYLPEALGNLTRLTSLVIENNYFSDVLPQSIGRLINLRRLIITNNMFSGSLPASMSNLVQLSSLNLTKNLFTGSVPAGLQQLSTLVTVDISFNYFSGTASFRASLSSCANFQLSANCFSADTRCATASAQRSSAVCSSSCGAVVGANATFTAARPVCSGFGTCLPSGSVTAGVATDWSCSCNANYRKGTGTFTCVPIPSPPPPRPPPRPPPPRPPRPPPPRPPPPPPCGGACPKWAQCVYLASFRGFRCSCLHQYTEIWVQGKMTCQLCTTVKKKQVCRIP